jgi:hypothetical protein
MANKRFWLGILTLMFVFGMTVIGCEPEENDKMNGHRYRRIDQIKSWTDAKAYSEELGGYLATITSAKEQSTIQELLANGDKKSYWIGGYRSANNRFLWGSGEAMGYTNWGYGEPDDLNSMQDYVSICRVPYSGAGFRVGFGEWDDEADRVVTNGFIVEWD